jgi:hypothetical protein
MTYDSKKNLEKCKHKYFDSCKLAGEQEKLVLKLLTDKENNQATDEEVKAAHGKRESLTQMYCSR